MNNKRKTLQKIAGIGAVATIAPSSWIKPVVSNAILPAHAQTSALACSDSVDIDIAILPAHAQTSALACSDSVDIDIFNFVGGDEQFGIDGDTCEQNNDGAVIISVDVNPQVGNTTEFDVTVQDATGLVAEFKLSLIGSGVTDTVSVLVEFSDTTARVWFGSISITINAFELEVYGEMNLKL